MPATYDPIATTTLGSAASSITFSSIPGTYTDLRLVLVAQSSSTTDGVSLRFNSDTGTNYSRTRLNGNGTTAASGRSSGSTSIAIADSVTTSPNFGLSEIDIFSYAGSTNKTTLLKGAGDLNGSGLVQVVVGLWQNTSAITSINLFPSAGGNFAANTTATLYGILKA